MLSGKTRGGACASQACFSPLVGLTVPLEASAQGEVSVKRGLQVSITGGCHDCHTEGYKESEGKIDPEKAMRGSSVGWRGPWGTTYATNLRVRISGLSEREFVGYLKHAMKTLPPMPWYNIRAMDESDLQSLYQYIKSLGEPGKLAPSIVYSGDEPTTPYIQLAPPQMPKKKN